jgi:FkbM family methyltransferase
MNEELHILENYFNHKRNGVVVECGTAEGHHMPSTYMENELGWKFIGFEIDPRFWPILLKNRPNGLNINLALSDSNEFTDFTVSAWGGNSSLQLSEEHKKELISYKKTFQNGTFFENIKVSTITWKTFINMYKISHVDHFILDVEGCEMKVLKGMEDSLVLPDVIQIEFSYSDPLSKIKNDELKEDFSGFVILKHALEKMGYEFNYVHFNDAFYSKKDFWKDKQKPEKWVGESDEFSWNGYCRYNKNKCKNL